MSPSRIARLGLQLRAATGASAERATHCQLCGQAIPVGAVAVPWMASPGWMDEASYATRSGVTCADCPPLLEAPVLRLGGMLVSTTGAFRIFRAVELRTAILNPPVSPPFVAVFPTGKMQHLLWRAPVTRDRRLFGLQLGERRLMFDVVRLRQLETDARWLARHLPPPKDKMVRTMLHPFSKLGLKPGELRLSIDARVQDASASPEDRRALQRLSTITADEAFVLTGLTYGNPLDAAPMPATRPLASPDADDPS